MTRIPCEFDWVCCALLGPFRRVPVYRFLRAYGQAPQWSVSCRECATSDFWDLLWPRLWLRKLGQIAVVPLSWRMEGPSGVCFIRKALIYGHIFPVETDHVGESPSVKGHVRVGAHTRRVHEEHAQAACSQAESMRMLDTSRKRMADREISHKSVRHRLGRKCRKPLVADSSVTRTQAPQVIDTILRRTAGS